MNPIPTETNRRREGKGESHRNYFLPIHLERLQQDLPTSFFNGHMIVRHVHLHITMLNTVL